MAARGSAGVQFEVDEHDFQPREVGDQEQEQAEAAAELEELAAGHWPPEAAESFLASLWNIGILVFGPGWAAQHTDFATWIDAACPVLDRWVPYSESGPNGLALAYARCAGGIGLMVAVKADAIRETQKQGPYVMRLMRQNQRPGAAPAARNGAQREAATAGAPSGTETAGGRPASRRVPFASEPNPAAEGEPVEAAEPDLFGARFNQAQRAALEQWGMA